MCLYIHIQIDISICKEIILGHLYVGIQIVIGWVALNTGIPGLRPFPLGDYNGVIHEWQGNMIPVKIHCLFLHPICQRQVCICPVIFSTLLFPQGGLLISKRAAGSV